MSPNLCSWCVAALLTSAAGVSAADEGPDIHFWVIENTKLEGGQHRTSALFLYHRTINADGSTYSSHYLNYIDAPGFRAVLPLWYEIGEPGQRHQMLVPLWFQGPGYSVAPLAMSGSWRRQDGGSSTWITPLFHADRDRTGKIEDLHLLSWLQGDNYRLLLPVFYRAGKPGREHTGVIPAWFSGPGYWASPLALSGGWKREDGGSSTWITPLFHQDRDAQGRIEDMHLLNWLHGQDGDALIPLAWRNGPAGARHHGLLPLWVDGPDYWGSPGLLSGGWRNDGGGRTTWVTPLFHRSTDASGSTTSFHALNWFHNADTDTVVPLAWLDHSGTTTTGMVIPFWFAGRNWWLAPPLLSGGTRGADGGSTQWITPLYHHSTSGDGKKSSRHLLTWFSGEDTGPGSATYQLLFPLFYHDRREVDGAIATHTAVLPLWVDGPGYTVVPPALSGRWRTDDGGISTWITPLYHRTNAADGSLRSRHAGLWYEDQRREAPDADGSANDSTTRMLFPLWWQHDSTVHGVTRRRSALLPLWYADPDLTVVPPLLSWWRQRPDRSSSLWVTPLFHRNRDADGTITSLHALTWFQAGDDRMLLPFFYRTGPANDRSYGVLPLWLANRQGWTAPPAMSWHRRYADGSDTTWLTPLAHVSHRADGSIGSLHVLNWIQGDGWEFLFPIAYRSGPSGQRHQGIIPLAFSGPNAWSVPPALSAGWKRADGGMTTWVTPLFHASRAADGSIDSLHAGPWFQGRDWQMLFPLAYRGGSPGARHQGIIPLLFTGPHSWAAPLALSGGWTRDNGGSTTWVTPLFHLSRDRDGHVDSMHALTWLDGDHQSGLLPLWMRGKDWLVAPPLLSARWRRDDGGHATWITPLFHTGSDAHGTITDWHLLNIIHQGDTDIFAPLAWSSGPPENRQRVILPLYFQNRDHLVVAPLYYRTDSPQGRHSGLIPLWFTGPNWWTAPLALSAGWSSAGSDTSLVTPFYHRTSRAGITTHMHLLNYISTQEMQAVAPVYWSWRSDDGGRRMVLAPLWYQYAGPDGEFSATAMPLLFNYHKGPQIDTSLGRQLFPFLVQNAPNGSEINLLWRIFHLRTQGDSTEMMIWPLWWSEHRANAPTRWQILGGLVGRDCDREQHTSLSYAAWGALRFGGSTPYATP